MAKHKVKILAIESVTHNVKSLKVKKPKGYSFIPGQATDVAINKPDFVDQKRSFTFTSLNDWDHLEFTIKIYNDHNGVTKEIGKLNVGEELIIDDPWGAINYKGEGTFIAGGAGVTPFIAILRDLKNKNELKSNKLIFANKTSKDIILKNEFETLLGNNFINILSDEKTDHYKFGFITKEFFQSVLNNLNQFFYLCGPDPMIESVEKILGELNVDKNSIVKENSMKSATELNAEIIKITSLIQEKYPELYEYLGEMPITIPTDQNPIINSQSLNAYYESLAAILNNYIYSHSQEKANESQSQKSLR